MQLSIALQGIVTQQLLPTADGSGRVVASEVLVPTPAIRNLIREGKTHQIYSAVQTSGAIGMQTMDANLAQLVRAGKITRQMAERRASVPEELTRLIGDKGGTAAAPPAALTVEPERSKPTGKGDNGNVKESKGERKRRGKRAKKVTA
jgi:twitching motility protein PilT